MSENYRIIVESVSVYAGGGFKVKALVNGVYRVFRMPLPHYEEGSFELLTIGGGRPPVSKNLMLAVGRCACEYLGNNYLHMFVSEFITGSLKAYKYQFAFTKAGFLKVIYRGFEYTCSYKLNNNGKRKYKVLSHKFYDKKQK